MYCYCVNLMSNQGNAKRILYQDSDLISRWTKEAQELLGKSHEITQDAQLFARVVHAHALGEYFMVETNRAGVRDAPRPLMSLVASLGALKRRCVNQGIFTAFRPEPFSLWVNGPAGIGKTFIKDTVIGHLNNVLDLKMVADDIHTVSPQQDFWTGAPGKKVLYYDDFCVTEGQEMDKKISEYCDVVGDARCSPPQSDNLDKGLCIAPSIVYVNSNEAHPDFNCLRTPEAFLRRRHVLVNAVLSADFIKEFGGAANFDTPGFKDKVESIRTEENPMPHMRFQFMNPMADSNHERVYYTFPEFLNELGRRAKNKWDLNMKNYRNKIATYVKIPTIDANLPLEDVLTLLREKSVHPVYGPEDNEVTKYLEERFALQQPGEQAAKSMMGAWSTKLQGWFGMSTEAEVCECDPSVVEKLAIEIPETGDPFLIWNEGPKVGTKYTALFCGDSCYYRTPEFLSSLTQLDVELDRVGRALAGLLSLDLTQTKAPVKEISSDPIVKELQSAVPPPTTSPWVGRTVAVAGSLLALVLLYKAGKGIYNFVCKTKMTDDVLQVQLPIAREAPPRPSDNETEIIGPLAQWWLHNRTMAPLLEKQKRIYDEYLFENAPLVKEDIETVTACLENVKCKKLKKLISNVLAGASTREFLEPDAEEYKDRFFRVESKVYSQKESSGKSLKGLKVKLPLATKSAEIFREAEIATDFIGVIERNVCFLTFSGKHRTSQVESKNISIRCFGIAGTWVVLLKHYITAMNQLDRPSIKYYNYGATQVLDLGTDYSSWELKDFEDSEICCLRLPSTVNKFRDLRKHFMTAAESRYMRSTIGIIETKLGQPSVVYDLKCKLEKDIYYKDNGVNMCIPAGFTYRWQNPGRCMSVLVQSFTRPKIVGFHICGGSGEGAGEPIVFESLAFIGEELSPADLPAHLTTEMTRTSIDGNFNPVGVVKPHLAARPAEKTQIIPSEIHGYVTPTTAPAPLCPSDTGYEFSPLFEGIKPHGRAPSPFPVDLLQRATAWLKESYLQNALPVRNEVGVLPLEEAVLGIPGLDGYEAMEMSTSEGFPFTALRSPQDSSKRYLFDIREQGETRTLGGIHQDVVDVMETKHQQRLAGEIPCTVFTDCLKDARIKISKLTIPGKTRIFSISPVDFTIQFRQYFTDILASQKVNRFNLNHSVGINVQSLEWTKLARHIQSKGQWIICGDYTNFGPTLPPDVVYCVGQVWCDWYEHHEMRAGVPDSERQANRRVRTVMFEEMRHAVHLVLDVLYRAPCGSPSGAPPTVNINNDVNKILIVMSWLDCWKDVPLMCSIVAFLEHCQLFVYGDDLVINVSDYAFTRFNNETIQAFLREYGIKYTDAQKGDTIRKGVTLSDADFLKGKFIQAEGHPGFFNYALDKSSLEDIANWIKRGGNQTDATKTAVYESLIYAYGWGKQYFTFHRERLLAALRDAQIQDVNLYTFDELDANRYEYTNTESGTSLDLAITKERELRQKQQRERLEAANVLL